MRTLCVIATVTAVITLGGCVTEKTVLTNDQGETKTCETKGRVGIVSGIRLYEKQHSCISNAKAEGYRETKGSASGSGTQPTPSGTGSVPPS